MKKLYLFLWLLALPLVLPTSLSAQQRLNEITQRGKLRVGMTGQQPPFSMESKSGKLIGYEVNLAELLAESMNLELELVRIEFNQLIPSIQNGTVDLVMSGMTINMERNMKVAFIGPYVISGKSVVTKSITLAQADEAADLNQGRLRVTSLAGSTSEKFVKTLLPEATSIPVANYDLAVEALLKDEANVMLADLPICLITQMRYPDANLLTLEDPLTMEPIGMALPADDPLLLNFIENYFNALEMTGLLKELENYWFETGSWLSDMK
ncbi:transporter substrate-binding domain-containing protein [Robiginitalea aurantiaca]|uniref:Transporter substrate-binding domain-containing protein n=1 Tax=Robiginitalea aurantiaca TaxID=3056915 RepID=A0ABT7WHL4_9FLAO|nr:transporter substrate-binding domain-containing protein [Robiginitalea aurantiaca]MDM9632415.1 transporter substrate-binding domain-containing protein [Robiginitalea aurantiaca]